MNCQHPNVQYIPDEEQSETIGAVYSGDSSHTSHCTRRDDKDNVSVDSTRSRSPRDIVTSVSWFPILDFHTVVSLSASDTMQPRTRASQLLDQVTSDAVGKNQPLATETLMRNVVLHNLKEALNDEFPGIGEMIILVECTPDVLDRDMVEEPNSHGYASGAEPKYGVARRPEEAIALYYEAASWTRRRQVIPPRLVDRVVWVAELEDDFCEWQIKLLQQNLAPPVRLTQKLEDMRLALQFVRSWMRDLKSDDDCVKKRMIEGHLKLVRDTWQGLPGLAETLLSHGQDTPLVGPPSWADANDMPYRRVTFQCTPTTVSARWDYLNKIRQNYRVWNRTWMAAQFRPNLLLAFEKLMEHTAEWLSYTDTDQAITESTIAMFFRLLRDRWNEFMDKTEKYAPPTSSPRKRSLADDKNDQDEETVKRTRCGSASMAMTGSGTSGTLEREKLPIEEVQWNYDVADDVEESSVVSIPVSTESVGGNPLGVDATAELMRAVESNNLERVQHAFTQGAIANGKDEFGETPLHKAAVVGNLDIIHHLRLWGSNPWATSVSGELALHVACWHGNLGATQALWKQLSFAPLDDMRDKKGHTPLHVARSKGHEHVISWFYNENVGKHNELRETAI